MHTPVLLQQTLEALQIKKDGQYIDATAGEGGHLHQIAEKSEKVLGIDWDESQIKNLELRNKNKNITLVKGNFANIEEIARKNKFYPVDGILFDFGLSMRQITESSRGFSFKNHQDPLDMRIDTNTLESAYEIVNRYSEEDLFEIFASYSEELFSRKIAQSIVNERKKRRLETVGDLIQAIYKVIENEDHKEKIYARIFQALRIVVNDEFKNIRKGLEGGMNILKPQGRIVTITFHSLEDRIVKQYVRINGWKTKVITGIHDYGKRSFERSATLRIIEK